MVRKALKEKLEEKLAAAESEAEDPAIANVVPFSKPDAQIVSPVAEFVVSISEAKQRFEMLQEYVKEVFLPDIDYGNLPNYDKPTLYKPGAEKFTDIFGFSLRIEVLHRVEDWKEGIFNYEVKTTLLSKKTGVIEAEGIGSCNSKEKRFACIDIFAIANSVLKMAKKRAFIDSVLSATRSSGLFTQDLDDMENIKGPPQKEQTSPETKEHDNKQYSQRHPLATKKQLSTIHSLVTKNNISVNLAKSLLQDRYKVLESSRLTLKQADDFIKYLLRKNSG